MPTNGSAPLSAITPPISHNGLPLSHHTLPIAHSAKPLSRIRSPIPAITPPLNHSSPPLPLIPFTDIRNGKNQPLQNFQRNTPVFKALTSRSVSLWGRPAQKKEIMTDAQSNRLDMYLIVYEFYTSNQVVLDDIPAITNAFNQLNANIDQINAEVGAQSSNTTGVTQDKTALRNTLDSYTATILATAQVWATQNNNNTLAAQFDYSLSDIQRIKDDTMQGFCNYRITLVNDNLAAMADFGLDAAAITDWQNALNAYAAAVERPRQAINARSLHTQRLKTLFSETSALFSETLDPLMLQFKITQPEIYAGYRQARIIIDRGGTNSGGNGAQTITLSGNVRNEQTMAPIESATVVFVSADDTLALNTQTDQSGNYTLTIRPNASNTTIQGTLTASAQNYSEQSTEIEATPGNSYVNDFSLNPLVEP